MDTHDPWDCIIVGAGPAGLTAALYLARFRRRTLVLHDGTARALWIPRTHNVPGFPDGVSGPELLDRMTAHAARYGAVVEMARLVEAHAGEGGFRLVADDGRDWTARAIVLATGAQLNTAPLPQAAHDAAVAAGTLRYCPICDGEEHAGRRIGVVGCNVSGAAEALFLKSWTDDLVLVPLDHAALGASERAQLAEAGVRVEEAPLDRLEPVEHGMRVWLKGRTEPLELDVVYPALGAEARNDLARQLGLEPVDNGCLSLRAPFGTAVAGLFAAGDLVDGLDQISVAMGHGAIAATRAHNWLRRAEGATLEAD